MKQRSYKFRFYPTKEQEQQLVHEFGCARFVYNHYLSKRTDCYQESGLTFNYYDCCKDLTSLKKDEDHLWLKNVTASVLQQKIDDLETSFKNFFDSVTGKRKGPKIGYPTKKKKLHKQSVRYQLDARQNNFESGKILKLPKLGSLNIKWSRLPLGKPKLVTVTKESSGKYYISFMVKEEIKEYKKTGKVVGIDIGIKDVIVTSDGFYSGAPRFTYKNARKLKLEQRKLSRKTKGSKSYERQRIKVARVHEHIANSRKDFLQKLSTKIVQEYDVICLEDLNVSGMLKNRRLSKAISDIGIGAFGVMLGYKASWYGKRITKISRWFPSSQMCSCCGQIHVEMKDLKNRIMKCDCGLELDRDLNAAINIRTAGEAGIADGALKRLNEGDLRSNSQVQKAMNSEGEKSN